MYEITLPNQEKLSLKTSHDVFFPTHTSVLCIQAINKTLKKPGSLLDLGCGCGVVGIAAHALGVITQLYASDFSSSAAALTAENAAIKGIDITVRHGSLFEPWRGMVFDYIADDVSGIAEPVAKLSPWFSENIPCNSGDDGSELTCQVLAQAHQYLAPNGVLLFPAISLSNTKKILDVARSYFKVVEKVASQTWMLPVEMLSYRDELQKLREDGIIDYQEKFGTLLCWTEIYQCHQTIKGPVL